MYGRNTTWFMGEVPVFTTSYQKNIDSATYEKKQERELVVRSRWYIYQGGGGILAHLFYIKKSDIDIPMIYIGTWSGINNFLLAPHFTLLEI